MKHLYNKIKPVGKRAIIAIDTNAKGKHTIQGENGKDIELYVAHEYSWDGKISNYTQATLLTDFKNLKAGTDVLIYHNGLNDEFQLPINDIPPYIKIYTIEDSFIYFGIQDDQIICLDGFMLAERIYEEPYEGNIIVTEKKKKESMLKIIGKPDSITDYEVGDIAITYKYSDYEVNHSIGGKQKTFIRLKYSDCLGKIS
jgi:hypothetical protein